MPAIFDNYLGGEIRFEKSWSNASGAIGLTPEGVYCHIGGQPITDKGIIRKVIEVDEEQRKALAWFDNKDKQVVAPTRYIRQLPDGSYRWDDGGAILMWEEILAYFSGQIPEDVAKWWAKESERREKMGDKASLEVAEAIQKVDASKGKGRWAKKMDSGERVITE